MTSARQTEIFYYNCWYVAAWGSDLLPGRHLTRTYLNEPVVLFRTASGKLGALEDRCCHRALPLSYGQVDGEIIRCSYHGLEYAVSGRCMHIPAQEIIPEAAKVRAYPLVEQEGILWIWMGDAANADPDRIPRHPHHTDAAWGWRSETFHLKGNWQLLADNLMDLSHLPYIHPHTIGGNPELHFKTKTEATRLTDGVRVQRHMPNSAPPPTYLAAKSFKGLIDRWQEIEFHPLYIRIHTGGCDAGTGAYEGRREHGFSMLGFHGITPETERTTHYIWSMATNILENDMPALVFDQTARTFREDQGVLEQQQLRIEVDPARPMLDIASDNGGRMTRQFIRRLLQSQTRPTAMEMA